MDEEAILTPFGDVQYDLNLSRKLTVLEQTPQGDIKDGSSTGLEQKTGATHITDSIVQMTPIGDVLIKYRTHKGDNGHQYANGNLMDLKRDDKRHVTHYGGSINNIKREDGTSLTTDGDIRGKASYGEHDRTSLGDGYNFLNRDNGEHLAPGGQHESPLVDSINILNRDRGNPLTPVEDKLSMHRPQNKGPLSLTSNAGDNKRITTLKSDKRAGEKYSEDKEAKFPLLKYVNLTSAMVIAGK